MDVLSLLDITGSLASVGPECGAVQNSSKSIGTQVGREFDVISYLKSWLAAVLL